MSCIIDRPNKEYVYLSETKLDPQHSDTSLGSLLTYGLPIRSDGTILIGLDNEMDILNPAIGQRSGGYT
ncbi:hypothetical protein [Spirosoma endophyticum]|uniref:hypothetical protein n=1 Tax=Spirosoma endophyticum TaxID=662367 RepID=UPI000B87CD4F|nr:hypothetical protein [Spirosoma endophyticum]